MTLVPVPAPEDSSLRIETWTRPTLRTRVLEQTLRTFAFPAVDAVSRIPGTAWLPLPLRMANHADYAAALLRPPRGTVRRPVRFPDFNAEWVQLRSTGEPAAAQAILYFHGGAFITGGLNTHRRFVATLSREAGGVPVFNVAYRQMPRHSIETSGGDALTAYRWLLERKGIDPSRLVVAGDSAGGSVAFGLTLAAIREGLPAPAGVVGISPGLDPDFKAKRSHPYNRTEAFLSAATIAKLLDFHDARFGPIVDDWQPLKNDLSQMPPSLIQVGSGEVLRLDAERMAEALAVAGRPCKLQIWESQLHDFQLGYDLLPEARRAMAEIVTFIREVTQRGAGEETEQAS